MAILVTGGNGFVGSWVVNKLAKKGEEIIIFDQSQIDISNIDYLEKYKDQINFVSGDILDFPCLIKMYKDFENQIEGVIHIAGLMGGPHFARNPHKNVRINTIGTLNMLEASRIFDVKKFVYISSGSVYGNRNDIPSEGDPVSPSDLYGAAKSSAELFGFQYSNEFKIDFRSARIYFVYGPGSYPGDLYPLYTAVFGPLDDINNVSLEAGKNQEIDFTYVEDAARGIVLLYKASELKNQTFNITSGKYMKVPDIIEIVKKISDKKTNIELGPGKIMPRGASLDISRAKDELNYQPEFDLNVGIKKYYNWLKKERKKESV